jgi:hypothetical protein
VADASDEERQVHRRNGRPPSAIGSTTAHDLRTWHERFGALKALPEQLQAKEDEDERASE